MSENKIIFNAQTLQRALARIAHEIAERNESEAGIVLIGIQRGGVHVASRLAKLLEGIWGHPVPDGTIDVSMHRDDIPQHVALQVHPTSIPFDLDGKVVILADDVFFSGRTVRAALDALHDFGRPRSIQLAVLIDRGHRQLPIKPDFVGKNVPTSLQERIKVALREDGAAEDSACIVRL
jgi:pyrimidine operon attenuation protein/uracil phosphoribosyltransferase